MVPFLPHWRSLSARTNPSKARAIRTIGMLVLMGGAIAAALPAAAADLKQSGVVHIEQVRVSFMGSGNPGDGTLEFKGQTYSFTVVGLGVSSLVQKVKATGVVYDLTELSDFKGAYVRAPKSIATRDTGHGNIWLQNTRGVVLEIKAERPGIAPSLGADGIYIDFN
jgi:hypothetical protein